MADYLESYAARFQLPVLTGHRVDSLKRSGGRFLVSAGGRRFEADSVVVAMANFQRARVPEFASRLAPEIVQIHSLDYKNPSQLRDGPVLIVGAGNSGSEIAMELAPSHQIWMSGRDVGHLPFNIAGTVARLIAARLFLRVVFHRVLTVRTPIGRKVRPKVLHIGGPLIRVKPDALARAGVQRAPRTTGAQGGLPLLADGRVLDVSNVIWCTGFDMGFDWIDLPVLHDGEPTHESGVVRSEPGLYFVGLHFLHALSSVMIHGVGRDAARVAGLIAARRTEGSAPELASRSA
jgi:putative flavoprotein involved in K+ transport